MTSETAPPPLIGPQRLHFAAAVGEALGAIRDVAVPLLIGLVAGGTNSSTSAIAIGLAGALIAAVIGTIRWQATAYVVTDRALHFKSGVFSPDETVVPLQRIQAVDTVTGPVQRVFGVTGLHVQTPGGGEDGDVVLPALSRAAAARLRAALGHPDTDTSDLHVRLTAGRLLAAALTAPQLGVLVPVVGAAFGLLQSSSIIEGARLLRDVDTWHEALLLAAVVLAAAFALSFAGALIAFAGFDVRLAEGRLRIRRGFWERRAVSVPIARIDGVQIVSSPLRRPFALVTLRLEATSLGERETVGRTLFPLMHTTEVGPFLAQVAPELSGPLTTTEHPPRRALRRYLTPHLLTALALSPLLLALIPSAWPATPLLLFLATLSGLDAYTLSGLRLDNSRLLLRTRRLGSSTTLIARRRRLQSHAIGRTPFQRRANLATLAVTVARGTRVRVRHLERPLAQRAFEAL